MKNYHEHLVCKIQRFNLIEVRIKRFSKTPKTFNSKIRM